MSTLSSNQPVDPLDRIQRIIDDGEGDELERITRVLFPSTAHEPETTRLRQLLWRIQPILNAGSEIAHAVEREVGSVHTNREGPLSGPAEPPSVEWISVKDKLPEFGQAVVYFFSLVGVACRALRRTR
jgi:hypothetical protein